VPAETTTVASPRAAYAFGNLGAALLGAELREYHELERRGTEIVRQGTVQLAPPGQRLLSYRILSPDDTIDLDAVAFRAERESPERITYRATVGDADISIAYTVAPDDYLIRVEGAVRGVTSPAFLLIDLPPGLRSAEADTNEDHRSLAYAYKPTTEGASSVLFARMKTGAARVLPGPHTWVAAKNKYFLAALLTPEGGDPFTELSVSRVAADSVKLPTIARATAVKALGAGDFAFEVYAGPQEWRRLHALGRDIENANPYGGFMQGLIQPFATAVMRLLLWMKESTRLNYGWVLIIFGIAIRLLLWPLNQRAMRSTMKMQTLQPEMADIQKRYRNDPQKMQSEMMRLYKTHGVSPFSMFSGCLPMLLPMPFLIALFFVFQNTIEFRGVSFAWLPDISVKDPYYILPLLMGVSMFFLSWIGMRGQAPNPQAKMMAYIFPPMMTVLFLNFASGLNLYYTVQNLAAIPQQYLIARERSRAPKPAPPKPGAPTAAPAEKPARAEKAGKRTT
jgi:YidC/Oxa1 family membrane protein insertase